MKIASASVYLVRWPFARPVQHSLAKISATENLIVRLADTQGRLGWGEGVARGYVTGETTEAAVAALKEGLLPRLLESWIEPSQVLGWLSRNFSPQSLDSTPAAVCAAEIALLDLAGQATGQPLSAFLGPGFSGELVYSAVLPLTDLKTLKALLGQTKKLGLTQVKVKVGRADDQERVALVRQILGPKAGLRLDANGAWSAKEAVAKIKALAPFGIEAVEQPVAKEDIEGLKQVSREVEVLVLADESVCTASQAARLIEAKAVGGFNLRLAKCGGPARLLQMLKLARQAGLACQLGCQVGELGLLSAAGRHLAQAQEFLFLEGSLTRFILDQDVIAEDLSFGQAGLATRLAGPGLGVRVAEANLASSHLFSLS